MNSNQVSFDSLLKRNPSLMKYCQRTGIETAPSLISHFICYPRTMAAALGLDQKKFEAFSRTVMAELQGPNVVLGEVSGTRLYEATKR